MSKAFWNIVREHLFPKGMTQAQVDGIKLILKETRTLSLPRRAYILATAYHETGFTMQPIKETERAGVSRTDAEVVRILENAWRKGQLKWVKTPYWRVDDKGRSWFGRGFVQLTHMANYLKAGKALGVDLVTNPSKALDKTVAVKVLVQGMMQGWFGRPLTDFINTREIDFVNARRSVNGTDRANEIAHHARVFAGALEVIGNEEPAVNPRSTSLAAAIMAALGGLGIAFADKLDAVKDWIGGLF